MEVAALLGPHRKGMPRRPAHFDARPTPTPQALPTFRRTSTQRHEPPRRHRVVDRYHSAIAVEMRHSMSDIGTHDIECCIWTVTTGSWRSRCSTR